MTEPTLSPELETNGNGRSRLIKRIVGVFLIVLALLIGWFALLGYIAWQDGQQLRVEKQREEAAAELENQITIAREDIASGRYNLALRRLEWILEQSPENEEALTLRQNALAGLSALMTPVIIDESATPTPTPLPTPTAGPIGEPAGELARIEQLIASEKWKEAVAGLVAFQQQLPDYERAETDRLLYEAYIQRGIELAQGTQIELGLFYFDQAERLGDLPQEALDYRLWGELYLEGIAYYGVNWNVAMYYFRDLCLAAPFYQSSCDLLYEALINYGDVLAGSLDWCPAIPLYEEALGYGRSQNLLDKLSNAREECALATPTPSVITDTVPLEGEPVETVEP